MKVSGKTNEDTLEPTHQSEDVKTSETESTHSKQKRYQRIESFLRTINESTEDDLFKLMESMSLVDLTNFFIDNLESVDEVFQFMDRINKPQRDFLNTHYS